ncbi:glycosyltransferase [Jatrophihabitans sp.]|uniref:glycosyltransferase n=1 Tax=Jatrophihabitans sp. TaxID=1932789 RepID=UPI002C7C9CF0|nr:glycosyltransferase [Jatrophihabitans sp.]
MATVSRCSVIIPTYNRAGLLRRTLDSLVAQTLPHADFEVLVVDDGSGDDTAELARSYTDRLDLKYFFQPDEGWRVAQARNVGIAHAAGAVCVMVDTGVLLHSGCLAAHLRSHQEAGGPVAVCGYVFGFDCAPTEVEELTGILDAGDLDAGIERISRSGRWTDTREPFYANPDNDFDRLPAPWVFYWTCNVSAPTARLRAVGGFDEQFRSWGGEDIDLGYRLFLDGARFVLNRAASSVHYPHPKNPGDLNHQARANYRYMAQKYDTPVGRLLKSFGGALHCYNINGLITARGLPDCREYLRQRSAAG